MLKFTEAFRRYEDKGSDPWRIGRNDMFLTAAARTGHLDIVKDHCARGTNVDECDEYGRTALMWATARGHVAFVKELLEHGADPNVRDKDGLIATSLVDLAPLAHQLDLMKLLYRRGAKLECPGSYNEEMQDMMVKQRFRCKVLVLVHAAILPVDVLRRLRDFV